MSLLLFLALLQQSASNRSSTPTPILNRDLFGVSIDRAGDLDGDGIEDLWIADPLCALPDMDGDGVVDFAIGGGSGVGLVCPGAVVLCSGKSFTPFRFILSTDLR